jgi:hypothetical protein
MARHRFLPDISLFTRLPFPGDIVGESEIHTLFGAWFEQSESNHFQQKPSNIEYSKCFCIEKAIKVFKVLTRPRSDFFRSYIEMRRPRWESRPSRKSIGA